MRKTRGREKSIEGVVNPAGPGTGTDGTSWFLTLPLKPWRESGGKWRNSTLFVSVPFPKALIRRLPVKYPMGTFVRLSIGKIKTSHGNRIVRGEAPVEILPKDPPALVFVDGPKAPPPISDPFFGTFVCTSADEAYETRKRLAGRTCRITLHTSAGHDVFASLSRARETVESAIDDIDTILEAATKKLLPLYNKKWRDERPVLSAEAFRKRMKLESIEIDERGTSLWFDSDTLFTEHAVEVRLPARGKMTIGIS